LDLTFDSVVCQEYFHVFTNVKTWECVTPCYRSHFWPECLGQSGLCARRIQALLGLAIAFRNRFAIKDSPQWFAPPKPAVLGRWALISIRERNRNACSAGGHLHLQTGRWTHGPELLSTLMLAEGIRSAME